MKIIGTRTGASRMGNRRDAGYTLIEVLVGILVFALGMMALAQLQTSLARNSGDANARTVAVNIAEETIEAARTFSQITSEAGKSAYNDIQTGTQTVNRGGNSFTVSTAVQGYYYVDGGFTTTPPLA